MGAIGLNPIRLDRIGLDPIRINAIKLGVPGASSDRPYIDPEVLASLKAVCICYGKSNDDPDRAVVKNLVDPDNPFVISNAAYDKMSSYGGYEFAKFDNTTEWELFSSDSIDIISRNGYSITLRTKGGETFWGFRNIQTKGFQSDDIPFKVRANKSVIIMWDVYGNAISDGQFFGRTIMSTTLNPAQDATISLKHMTEEELNELGMNKDGMYYGIWFDLSTLAVDEEVTIEMLPLFEGAFVTDGIYDLITSTKTVQEMLGGSNEITVVSLITHISGTGKYNIIGDGGIQVSDYSGQTFMAGTSSSGEKIVELGDKEKLQAVQYTTFDSKLTIGLEDSSYAYYGTFVFNKENVPVDWIHQVIAYFNLDRTLNPDILCNTIKQGITNENHAEFGDKLIDYSGNGRDILLNNIAWKGGSGIAAKPFETIKDYLIVPDEGLQELTIYNEFSYKVKSIKYADRYWTVQSVNKTDTSYPVTIITDKDIVWRNALNYTDADGVKGSVRKETNVPANTPTQVFIYGFNDFDISDDYTKVNCVAYATRKDITEFTVTFIPSYKGGLLLDGIADFGKVTGMPIYKDYTIIADYERISGIEQAWAEALISKSYIANQGAFVLMETNGMAKHSYSFGAYTTFNKDDSTRTLLYQSKYKCGDVDLNAGTGIDGDTLWLGTYRDNYSSFFNGAIYSLMSFPYSMSEFLIERQLKKHKLGTLYPDMVEWRPIYTSNVNDYTVTKTSYFNEGGQRDLSLGSYCPISTRIRIYVKPNGAADEVTSIKVNGVELTYDYVDSNYGYAFNGTLSDKSPQKINITIDEYIRFEDIVQPYPLFFEFTDENGNLISWGGKAKVGSTITRTKGVNYANLLEGLFTITNPRLNGVALESAEHIVEKSMVFTCTATWAFDNNEPKCILSPRLLSIPNSSYKILGYIPDISGHGNNGVINNSAYTEGSGVNEDGSYQFDGVDDFVAIPTTVGGKQILMKVNWQSDVAKAILYDQRGYTDEFAIYNTDVDIDNNSIFAYQGRNNGQTYIDGILNNNIIASNLRAITHNITITNELSLGANNTYPVIGTNKTTNGYYANMALYDFMLFDEISTEDKILELNEYVGIEGNTDDLFNETN